MNKRNLVLALVSIVGAIAILSLGLRVRSSPRVQQTSVATQPSAISATPSPEANIAQTTPTVPQIVSGTSEPSDPRWKEREMKRRMDPQYEWKLPINFFGRVIDEHEHPVAGATIVAQWSDLSADGASTETHLTNEQGLFSITAKTGRGITIRVAKDGYY